MMIWCDVRDKSLCLIRSFILCRYGALKIEVIWEDCRQESSKSVVVLPLWQNAVCSHRQTLINFDSMFCWRSARFCPWTTIILDLHFTHLYHSPDTPYRTTAIRWWHATLCHYVTYQLQQRCQLSSSVLGFPAHVVLWKWDGSQPIQISCHHLRHVSASQVHTRFYTCKRS